VTHELRDAIEQAVLAEWERMNKPRIVRVTRKRIVTEYIELDIPTGLGIDDMGEVADASLTEDWTELEYDDEVIEIKEVI
jgi:hypothetical protein